MIDKTDPTNRDTVPAMLTPGEFVLNKEATQMYGPVIQQMNNAGLQQRAAENKAVEANMGGGIPPKGYNTGAQVQGLKGFLDFITPRKDLKRQISEVITVLMNKPV